jgi:site-specific recombinase XerD
VNIAPAQQTLKAFLKHWLEQTVKRFNRPRTYDKYAADVRHHIIPSIGQHQIAKLTPDHVQLMLNTLTSKGLSANTVRNVRAVLEKKLLGDDWPESGLVFVSRRGTPLEPGNVVRHFKTVLRKAGLPETTRFHDLRHSCAALLIAQGVHLSVIKDILGHTQISTTANIYGHVLPEIQREATEKLDGLLSDREADRGTI